MTLQVFAGKHGFITPRDLFRWAERGAVGYQVYCRGSLPCLKGAGGELGSTSCLQLFEQEREIDINPSKEIWPSPTLKRHFCFLPAGDSVS